MVTLKDIATKAGVNVSSVSKALNNSKEISREKREEIKRIAKEMNYIPNLSARALAGKGTNSIGIILPEIQSNYYARMMNRIEEELLNTKYSIIMSTTNFNLQREIQYINVLCSRAVDGILLIGAMHGDIEDYVASVYETYHIPVLFLESFVELRHHDFIMVDNRYGIELAVEHLAALGHKDIGYISEHLSAATRLPWFKNALSQYKIRLNKRFVKVGEERFELGGYLRMKELLQEPDYPHAVFASYDNLAIGAMKAIEEAGLRIPQDIAIIGFDNIREAEYLVTPLSTIVPPITEMVRIGVKLLLDKIDGMSEAASSSHKISLRPDLAVRTSTVGSPV